MQYLDIRSTGITISKKIPAAIITQAMALIESTVVMNNSGNRIEAMLDGDYLQLSGEGAVSEIEPLICGLNMIEPFLNPGSSINIEVNHDDWETIVRLNHTVH